MVKVSVVRWFVILVKLLMLRRCECRPGVSVVRWFVILVKRTSVEDGAYVLLFQSLGGLLYW